MHRSATATSSGRADGHGVPFTCRSGWRCRKTMPTASAKLCKSLGCSDQALAGYSSRREQSSPSFISDVAGGSFPASSTSIKSRWRTSIMCRTFAASQISLTNSASLIYACQVIEYFDREEVVGVLTDWRRVLVPVRDLETLGPELRRHQPSFISRASCSINSSARFTGGYQMARAALSITARPMMGRH